MCKRRHPRILQVLGTHVKNSLPLQFGMPNQPLPTLTNRQVSRIPAVYCNFSTPQSSVGLASVGTSLTIPLTPLCQYSRDTVLCPVGSE